MKQREPAPPGKYLRSKGGVPAEVIRTCKRNDDGLWLYHLWYGDVTGNQLWTLDELLATAKQWMQRRPRNLRDRKEKDEVTR